MGTRARSQGKATINLLYRPVQSFRAHLVCIIHEHLSGSRSVVNNWVLMCIRCSALNLGGLTGASERVHRVPEPESPPPLWPNGSHVDTLEVCAAARGHAANEALGAWHAVSGSHNRGWWGQSAQCQGHARVRDLIHGLCILGKHEFGTRGRAVCPKSGVRGCGYSNRVLKLEEQLVAIIFPLTSRSWVLAVAA